MSERVLNYDIAIIGSGAGGGTVAKELAPLCAQGAKIALLEWGGHFKRRHNTRDEIEMAEKYYFDHGGFQTDEGQMTLAFARAVGGSTTVYTGTSLKAPAEVFDRWNVPGVDLEDLEPRYEKYIQENNVHLNPPEEINENNLLFAQGCKKLGWKVEQFPVNTKGCVGLGTCNLGCAIHAKQGTAVVQIPEAQRQGVELIPFCRVDRIEGNDVIAQIIPPQFDLQPSLLPVGRYRFRAKKIILSAGAIFTPTILLRSFRENLSPAMGRYFTCHPALILAGEHPQPIQNTIGHPKSFYSPEFADSDYFLLETCIYFPFTLAKSLTGFGEEVDEFMSHFDRLQMILVLTIDLPYPENRVELDKKGNPRVHYRFTKRLVYALIEACRASARIFFAAGVKRVHTPAMERFFIHANEANKIDQLIRSEFFKLGKASISAAHLMGGCRMGTDPEDSVTDPWGKIHGKDHLYVADASLFPAASEVNPYLTIMALADRVAEGVRRDLERGQ